MAEVVNDHSKPQPSRRLEPSPKVRCVLCGKQLNEDMAAPWATDRPLCFWCAYVEPQG